MFRKNSQDKGREDPVPDNSGWIDPLDPPSDIAQDLRVTTGSNISLSVPPTTDVESRQTIVPQLYGEKTTFGSMPWWSDRDWWKLARSGEGNDLRAHVGTVGDLAVAATSVRGHKHRLGGADNQDSYATGVTTLEDGRSYAIVVICDGMGSAQFSSFGARLFAHHMVSILSMTITHCPDNYNEVLAEGQSETIDYASTRVLAYRSEDFDAPSIPREKIDVRDLQCTMTFAVVPAFSTENYGRRTALFGFIGDSPAFHLFDQEWFRVDQDKDGTGVWSSATEGAINSPRMDLREVDLFPGSAVLLSSDGVGNYIRFNDQMTALGQDLAHRWSSPVGLLDFVRDVSFETQSADDDRTAAVIWVDR